MAIACCICFDLLLVGIGLGLGLRLGVGFRRGAFRIWHFVFMPAKLLFALAMLHLAGFGLAWLGSAMDAVAVAVGATFAAASVSGLRRFRFPDWLHFPLNSPQYFLLSRRHLAAFEKCYSGLGICGFVLLVLPQPLSAFGRRLPPSFCQFARRSCSESHIAHTHCCRRTCKAPNEFDFRQEPTH